MEGIETRYLGHRQGQAGWMEVSSEREQADRVQTLDVGVTAPLIGTRKGVTCNMNLPFLGLHADRFPLPRAVRVALCHLSCSSLPLASAGRPLWHELSASIRFAVSVSSHKDARRSFRLTQ